MTQEEIDARRRQLAEEYLDLDDGLSERGLQIAHEFGVLSKQERRLQQSEDKPLRQSYVQESEERSTRLTLAEAKSLAKRMGLSDKTVSKLKLRAGMQQDAVFTLVRQHLRLAERKKRKVRLGEETVGADERRNGLATFL
jgi:hypothetical protein